MRFTLERDPTKRIKWLEGEVRRLDKVVDNVINDKRDLKDGLDRCIRDKRDVWNENARLRAALGDAITALDFWEKKTEGSFQVLIDTDAIIPGAMYYFKAVRTGYRHMVRDLRRALGGETDE